LVTILIFTCKIKRTYDLVKECQEFGLKSPYYSLRQSVEGTVGILKRIGMTQVFALPRTEQV
jgi:hypothetical protein